MAGQQLVGFGSLGEVTTPDGRSVFESWFHFTNTDCVAEITIERIATNRYEEIGNTSQVCREFGISRKTFYRWWPCYVKGGLPELNDRCNRPKSRPKTALKDVAQLIVKLCVKKAIMYLVG